MTTITDKNQRFSILEKPLGTAGLNRWGWWSSELYAEVQSAGGGEVEKSADGCESLDSLEFL